jgi:hypothetical protein
MRVGLPRCDVIAVAAAACACSAVHWCAQHTHRSGRLKGLGVVDPLVERLAPGGEGLLLGDLLRLAHQLLRGRHPHLVQLLRGLLQLPAGLVPALLHLLMLLLTFALLILLVTQLLRLRGRSK